MLALLAACPSSYLYEPPRHSEPAVEVQVQLRFDNAPADRVRTVVEIDDKLFTGLPEYAEVRRGDAVTASTAVHAGSPEFRVLARFFEPVDISEWRDVTIPSLSLPMAGGGWIETGSYTVNMELTEKGQRTITACERRLVPEVLEGVAYRLLFTFIGNDECTIEWTPAR